MWTFSRVIFPLLGILVMTPVASATTDAPDLVLIDIDLHWTVPVYGALSFSGRQEWRNGVGYTDTSKSASGSGIGSSDRWQITGLPCMTCFWVNSPATLHPGQFVLDFESAQPQGIPHFIVALDGQFISPVVRPGEYAVSGAAFGDPGISCCPVTSFFAESGHISVVTAPELKILRRLVPKHIYGRELAAVANPRLQPLTAWGATKVLQALHIPASQKGVFITLPSVRLEVQEWCSGLVSMKWLTALALVIALAVPAGLPWKIALVLTAPLIALEVNMLRVAGIGAGVESFGYANREAIKEWAGWATMGLGVVQVVGLGWLITIDERRRSRTREAERA